MAEITKEQKQRAELTTLKEDIGDLSKKLLYEVTRPIDKKTDNDKDNKKANIKNLKNRLKEKIGIFNLLMNSKEIIKIFEPNITVSMFGGLPNRVVIDGKEYPFMIKYEDGKY